MFKWLFAVEPSSSVSSTTVKKVPTPILRQGSPIRKFLNLYNHSSEFVEQIKCNAHKIDKYWHEGGLGYFCSNKLDNASKAQLDALKSEGMSFLPTLTTGQASDLLSCIYPPTHRFFERIIKYKKLSVLPKYQIDLILMELEIKKSFVDWYDFMNSPVIDGVSMNHPAWSGQINIGKIFDLDLKSETQVGAHQKLIKYLKIASSHEQMLFECFSSMEIEVSDLYKVKTQASRFYTKRYVDAFMTKKDSITTAPTPSQIVDIIIKTRGNIKN